MCLYQLPLGKYGWRVYGLETIDLLISRDIVYYEKIFPYLDTCSSLETNTTHFQPNINKCSPLNPDHSPDTQLIDPCSRISYARTQPADASDSPISLI